MRIINHTTFQSMQKLFNIVYDELSNQQLVNEF